MKPHTKLFHWLQRYVWALLLVCVLGSAWLIGRRQAEQQVASGTKASLPQNAAVKATLPAYPQPVGPVYRYSVVEGGVRSLREMQQAVASDAVVASHYKEINTAAVQPVRLQQARRVFVSYRKDDVVYWTKQRVTIPAGELLLSDGKSWIRARCGNRLSATPQAPVSGNEPAAAALDERVIPGKSTLSEKDESPVAVATLLFPSRGFDISDVGMKQPAVPLQPPSQPTPPASETSPHAMPPIPPAGLPGGTPNSPTPTIPSTPVASTPIAPSPLTLTFLPEPAPVLPLIDTAFGTWQPTFPDQEQLYFGEPPLETLPQEIPPAPAELTAQGGASSPPSVPPGLITTGGNVGAQPIAGTSTGGATSVGGTQPGFPTPAFGEQTNVLTPGSLSEGVLPTNPGTSGSTNPGRDPVPKPTEPTLAEVPEPRTFLLACAGFGFAYGRSMLKRTNSLSKDK